jgi:hypothetical protein
VAVAPGENGLDAHVLLGKFLMERQAEGQDKRLRSVIDTVQDFRREAKD